VAGLAPPSKRARVKVGVVKENGKVRVVTAMPSEMSRLKPLHEALYERLTKEKWCLRGDAKPSAFREFTEKEGEVFVSGDYESATDFLDIETTEFLMEIILRNARVIPPEIRDAAMSSFRCDLFYPGDKESGTKGETVRQVRGQLMGAYLSFPLLCLRNFLSFAFLTRGKALPVKINGDDIVFRARPEVATTWMEGVERTGLKLSKGKTLVHQFKFSLNSTFFLARKRRAPALCPVIRAKSLLNRDSPPDEGGFRSFMSGWTRGGFSPFWERASRKVGGLWLRSKRPAIDALGRGVWGLGVKATPSQLHESNLVGVETYFNPGGRRFRIAPARIPVYAEQELPYRRATREEVKRVAPARLKEWDEGLSQWFHHRAWTVVRRREEAFHDWWWKECKETGAAAAIRSFFRLLNVRKSKAIVTLFRSKAVVPGYGPEERSSLSVAVDAGRYARLPSLSLPLGTPPPVTKKSVWVPLEWEPPKLARISWQVAT